MNVSGQDKPWKVQMFLKIVLMPPEKKKLLEARSFYISLQNHQAYLGGAHNIITVT